MWFVAVIYDKILTRRRFINAGLYSIASSVSNDSVDEIQIGA